MMCQLTPSPADRKLWPSLRSGLEAWVVCHQKCPRLIRYCWAVRRNCTQLRIWARIVFSARAKRPSCRPRSWGQSQPLWSNPKWTHQHKLHSVYSQGLNSPCMQAHNDVRLLPLFCCSNHLQKLQRSGLHGNPQYNLHREDLSTMGFSVSTQVHNCIGHVSTVVCVCCCLTRLHTPPGLTTVWLFDQKIASFRDPHAAESEFSSVTFKQHWHTVGFNCMPLSEEANFHQAKIVFFTRFACL